jgi:hypothetical protein
MTDLGESREAIRRLERIGLSVVRGVVANGSQLRPGRSLPLWIWEKSL